MIDIESLKQELAAEPAKPAQRKQSNIGIMRAMYDEISQKHEAGWRAGDLVEWLGAKGVVMSENCFRNYLYQIDRERGRSRIAEREQGKDTREEKPAAQPAKPKPQAPAQTTTTPTAAPAPNPAKKEQAETSINSEFPTSEKPKQTAATTAAKTNSDAGAWGDVAARLKMGSFDEKGFATMPGEEPEK